jgi:ATP-binding cassette, subfamily B, bacterial
MCLCLFVDKLKDRLASVSAVIPVLLPRALRLISSAAPGLAIAWVTTLLIQGALPALTLALTRTLVDRLVTLLAAPLAASYLPVVLPALGIGSLHLASQVLQSLQSWLHTAQSEAVSLRVMGLIQDKSSQVDYSFFETPEQHDKLHRARIEAAYRPLAVMSGMGMLAQGLVTLAAMTALLLPYGAWLVLFLFASGLPVLYVVVHHKRRQHRWERTISESERRAWYYDYLLSAPETAAELRLFGVRGRFMAAYRDIRTAIRAGRLDHERRQAVGQLAAATIGLLAAGVCMAYMGWRALQGQASLGDLVLFYGVLSQGQGVLRGLLQNAGSLYGSLLFLGNLFEFLDLPNQVADPAEARRMPPDAGGAELRFENVTFAYPGAARPVLQGFNLHLPGGSTTALLGDNGAGKSTLLKLLCRLYDPQEGRITWDGIDLRDLALETLRHNITVLFQEPVNYQASVHENIALSRNGATPPGRVEWAADHAGAVEFIHGLPQAYETRLGKWFEGGVDLSVGQWQRIALARAFLRSAPLMLLDEPTHAMDAWSEAEWLGRFRQLSAGRTTLMITHRLTTAVQADCIYVMACGRIIEAGTHAELLERSGRYAQAWKAQVGER